MKQIFVVTHQGASLLFLLLLSVLPVQAQIDSLIKYRLPQGSNVAICAYDLTAKRPLYGYQQEKLSRPASTMKLLTTITALAQPDADAPFRTEVYYTGTIERDTLRGDLCVVGGFDPEFDEEALDSLARAVNRLPFSVIDGCIIGDVSMKDSLYWGSGWAWDDTPATYQPYLSPLMLCKGTVTVTATPAARGDTAHVTVRPASTYYTIDNQTVSRTPQAGPFRVTRNWLENGNRITVSGNVPSTCTASINLFGSAEFFMQSFADRIKAPLIPPKGGIPDDTDDESYKSHKTYKIYNTYNESPPFGGIEGGFYETPVQKVIKQIMKESDNLNAEAMLCRLGAQATGKKQVSAEDGLDAIRRLIKQLGYDPDRYSLADGCGLSNYNYISPELLVAFLRYAYSRTDIFQRLYKALPVAGVDGTLKHRMKGTAAYRNVHAKTGSFTAINCLAGYLKASNGHDIAFAIMNQNALSAREARAFQDAVCNELINYSYSSNY